MQINICMITVIIPTLWLSDVFDQSITSLNNLEIIKDIIVIDNCAADRNLNFEKFGDKQCSNQITDYGVFAIEQYGKIRVVVPKENLYVSKSWNIGAYLSSQQYLCILNDDVVLPDSLFDFVVRHMSSQVGIIGLHADCFKNESNNLSISPVRTRPNGFGCCMFIERYKYVPIPESIQIWYNDDYLFSKIPGIQYSLTELKVSGSISKTVNNTTRQEEIKKIISQDRIAYITLMNL